MKYRVNPFTGELIDPKVKSTELPPDLQTQYDTIDLDAPPEQPEVGGKELAAHKDTISCVECGSSQLTAQKQGFGIVKGAALGMAGMITGGVALGALGLGAGNIGKGKVTLTCLKCGHTQLPGQD